MLKNTPSLVTALGLAVQIPDSMDDAAVEALLARIPQRIHDYHGQRAVEAFTLGSVMGRCFASLAPRVFEERSHSLVGIRGNFLAYLSNGVTRINRQLEFLHFPERLSLDTTSAARSYTALQALDERLTDSWDPVSGVWQRTP